MTGDRLETNPGLQLELPSSQLAACPANECQNNQPQLEAGREAGMAARQAGASSAAEQLEPYLGHPQSLIEVRHTQQHVGCAHRLTLRCSKKTKSKDVNRLKK